MLKLIEKVTNQVVTIYQINKFVDDFGVVSTEFLVCESGEFFWVDSSYYKPLKDNFDQKEVIGMEVWEAIGSYESGWIIEFKNGNRIILTESAYKKYDKETPKEDVACEEHWFSLRDAVRKNPGLNFIE